MAWRVLGLIEVIRSGCTLANDTPAEKVIEGGLSTIRSFRGHAVAGLIRPGDYFSIIKPLASRLRYPVTQGVPLKPLPPLKPLTARLSLCLALAFLAGMPGRAQTPAEVPLSAIERRIRAYVKAHEREQIDFLEKAVNINSGTLNLAGVLALDLSVSRQPSSRHR